MAPRLLTLKSPMSEPPEPGIAGVRLLRSASQLTDSAQPTDPDDTKTQSVMAPCGLSPAVNPGAIRHRFQALVKDSWQQPGVQPTTAQGMKPLPSLETVLQAAATADEGAAASPEIQATVATLAAAPSALDYNTCWKKAQSGDTQARYILGILFATGSSRTPRDTSRAVQWLRKAADRGHAGAQFSLGILMRHTGADAADAREGFRLIVTAAKAGFAEAQNVVGKHLLKGEILKSDPVAARRWFQLAAEAGLTEAQALLAGMQEKGVGGPVDAPAARKWAERAASAGSIDGQYILGCLLGRRHASKADLETAYAWFHKAAAQGHAEASARIRGLTLLNETATEPHPVPMPLEKARKLRRLADKGDADAQCALGALYANQRQFPEAVKWFQCAAEHGHPGGQNRLAGLYLIGVGLAADPAAAAYWFYQAANQGLTDAQIWLGELYVNGCGVPKDPLRAYKWLKLAANKGDLNAKRRCRSLLVEHHKFL